VLERRPAAADDEPFLRELYASTRPELGLWDDAEREQFVALQVGAQRAEWEARFPGSVEELIALDGRLVDMALLPEHRRGGIGTRIVREVLDEADRRGIPARLTVEATNGPSLAFCARLGFAVVGEDPVYVLLERPVNAPRPPRASG
jgi:GNAT superfamily N-acetyltransferase